MSDPLPGAVPLLTVPPVERLHTDVELAALAAEMPTVPAEHTGDADPRPWTVEYRAAVGDPEPPPLPGPDGAPQVVPASAPAAQPAAARVGIRDGGTVIRPSNGQRVRWTPIEAVADEYEAAKAMASRGYRCLGVIGNQAHLRGSGGHTPWCSEGYNGRACRFGKVYAIDLVAPDMRGMEKWLVGRLRGGAYPWVYYLNINNHQYTRKDGFRGQYYSSDSHLHLSGLAGHEATNSKILREWNDHRTKGSDDMAQVPQAQWDRARTQLDAISDILDGGKGAGYQRSRLRADHNQQVEEIERRIKAHVDTRLNEIETKLDRLITAVSPTPPTT